VRNVIPAQYGDLIYLIPTTIESGPTLSSAGVRVSADPNQSENYFARSTSGGRGFWRKLKSEVSLPN
jgi:hypothetical protein